MRTGEGKTLVSTLPAYLNGLTEKGVHIVTVNDYLAKRDQTWMGQLHRFLGLDVGLVQETMNSKQRQNNYNSDITYSISSPPANGQAAVSSSGAISYMPNQDYNGQDTFVIRVSATRIDSGGQSSGTPITKTQSVTMTINPINDAPVLTLLDDFSGYGDTSIIFDDLLNMNISVSDVDNDNSELQFYGSMPTENISGVYGDGTTSSYVTLDFSGLNTAGLLTMSLCVSDGSIETCASDQIQAYYVANKEVKNVAFAIQGT